MENSRGALAQLAPPILDAPGLQILVDHFVLAQHKAQLGSSIGSPDSSHIETEAVAQSHESVGFMNVTTDKNSPTLLGERPQPLTAHMFLGTRHPVQRGASRR